MKIVKSGRPRSYQVHFRKGDKPTDRTIVIAFQILESGEVADTKMKQSSGVADIDRLALEFVQTARYNQRKGCGIVESNEGVTVDFS